ncbi:hypothetical protein Q3G72_016174 [Acer saccharum]|nr:hypothetical protein Q3G72_016174 [Acer saccharum]
MDDHIEDKDRDALAGLTSAPPHRKNTLLQPTDSYRRKNLPPFDEDASHSLLPQSSPSTVDATDPNTNKQLYNDHLYDSSDDDFFARGPSSTADIDKDYITQSIYIDDDDADQPDQRQLHPLPEFVGSGGGVGIFKVSGVRYWNFDIACDVGCGLSNRLRRGDEDAAPFHESVNTSPTTCLMVDSGNKLVFSGHKDGKIRSWKTDQSLEDNNNPLREGLSWQAHRGPVLAMLFSSHGDLWSGGEGGIIKIWPWESIEKSLS